MCSFLEALLIDSTVVRANQHAAGAQKRRLASVRALARRAEHEDSYHGRCAGNPLRWIVTGGEVADITQAPALIEGLNTQADKGYDADALVARIQAAALRR